jgi:Barstar (barnase inhibitor)
MAVTDVLASTDPPHVHLAVVKPGEDVAVLLAAPPSFVARAIDGRRCRTKAALLDALAHAFALPAATGRNWDAIEEALADLEWLPARGYILIVSDADVLLEGAADEYRTFVAMLEDVGREWARPRAGEWPRPAAPFHTCLAVAAGRQTARADWGAAELEDLGHGERNAC